MACDHRRPRWNRSRSGVFCVALAALVLPIAARAGGDDVKVHVVRRGETLTRIAGIHGTTVDELREWNQIRGTRILVGQELQIPVERQVYRVKSGDTLGRISREQGVPVDLIRQLNQLRGDRIYPGQRLKLHPSHADEVTHVVVAGETLSEIARDHEVSVRQLRTLNGIEGSRIVIGQVLRLREAESTVHIVERGDALWEIARAYGISVRDLRAINGLTSDRIYPGQELQIRGATRPSLADYRVRRGDTLGEIAQLHQMSVHELRQANALRGDRIYPGQTLKVRPLLGDDSTGLGLLSPEEIPWATLAPASTRFQPIELSNGPYYTTRPRAQVQPHDEYNEGSPIGPWKTWQQADALYQEFDRRIDAIGRLSHDLDGWSIVIDPGHGGVDPGTIVQARGGNGETLHVVEDEYVFDIALRMYVLFRLHGADVTLTLLSPNHLLRGNQPATDTFVHERNEVFNSREINRRNAASSWPRGGARALGYRRSVAAEAYANARRGRRVFISLHADNSPQSPEAATVFYHQARKSTDRDSRRFAEALLPAMGAGSRARGRNLGVLRGNPADVAVLVEIRNLAYPSQTWALRYEKLRQRDAEKIVKGVLDWSTSSSAIALGR
jgi:LysM repeat protein